MGDNELFGRVVEVCGWWWGSGVAKVCCWSGDVGVVLRKCGAGVEVREW